MEKTEANKIKPLSLRMKVFLAIPLTIMIIAITFVSVSEVKRISYLNDKTNLKCGDFVITRLGEDDESGARPSGDHWFSIIDTLDTSSNQQKEFTLESKINSKFEQDFNNKVLQTYNVIICYVVDTPSRNSKQNIEVLKTLSYQGSIVYDESFHLSKRHLFIFFGIEIFFLLGLYIILTGKVPFKK